MGVEDTTKTDTRTETSDKPAPQERPTPPPDNPGSPGQPSRLESLRRAREQQEGRAQETQGEDAGTSPREQRDDKTASEQSGSREESAASGTPEAEDKQQGKDKDQREDDPRTQDQGTSADRETATATPGDPNRDRPQAQPAEPQADTRTAPADRPASSERQWTPPADNPGSPGQPSRLESLARAREHQQAPAAQRTEVANDREPSPERDGEKADPPVNLEGASNEQDTSAPMTDEGKAEDRLKPDTSEAPPTPERNPRDADKPTDDARQPTVETTDQPTNPQERRPSTTTGELDPLERISDPPRTAEQSPQIPDGATNAADQSRPESAEPPTPLADDADQSHPTGTPSSPGDEPTSQNAEATPPTPETGSPGEPSTDNTSPSPEEPNRNQETGQHDGDRDKKSEEPETSQPEGHIRPNFTPYNAEDGKTYYTVPLEEISRNSDHTDQSGELEKADEERSPYAMTLDEYNRASLSPTDADIEPGVVARPPDRREQTDNETESRIDRARRATWMRGGDLKDAGKALSDTANGILGPRPPTPTGRTETGTGPYIAPTDAKGATPDAFVATVTAAMLAIEGARKAKQVGSQLADRIRGRDNDSNG